MKNTIHSFKMLMLLNKFNIKFLAFMLINSIWIGIFGFLMIGEEIGSEYFRVAIFLISLSLILFIKSFSGYSIEFIISKKFLFSTNISKKNYSLASIIYNNILGLIYIIISFTLKWCMYSNKFGTITNWQETIFITLIITAFVATADVLFMCNIPGFIVFIVLTVISLKILNYNHILLTLTNTEVPLYVFALGINLILNISAYLYCSYIYRRTCIVN